MKKSFIIAALFFPLLVGAQEKWPSKPVKIIVPYPAGGAGDILARGFSDIFLKRTGYALIVENKVGANGIIGMNACKAAIPDGHTFCMPLSDAFTINPYIYKNLPYGIKDFSPVVPVGNVITVIAVNKDLAANNLKDLSDRNNSQINWGSWGVGSSGHLVVEQTNKSFNTNIRHIPYQGLPQVLNAVLSGEVEATMMLYGPLEQYIKKSNIKPLAVMSDKRYHQLPDIPTANEQGMEFPTTLWYGLFAPAGTSKEIIDKMNALIRESTKDEKMLKIMNVQGFDPIDESTEKFKERINKDEEVWGALAKSLNLNMN